MTEKIFTTAYLGPVQYYAHLLASDSNIIEQFCHYSKQSYRNRCVVMAANGPLSLVIPVVKSDSSKTATRDIRISYDTPWNSLHWKSIESAYNSSPYFEYYMDDFKPFYLKQYSFLLDYNMSLMEVVFNALGIGPKISLSENYYTETAGFIDLRETIHPKRDYRITDHAFQPVPYRQLFLEKFGFVENLSIIDLLFNKGPESLIVLNQSMITKH